MTRLVVYATLGLLLDALGLDYQTWGFWCTLALFVVSDSLARRDGYEQGVVHGMVTYIQADQQQRQDLDKIVKDND